jgi:hypothetical protein
MMRSRDAIALILIEFSTLFLFYKNIFYKNIQAENREKIKNIVVILYVVISLSFPAWAKKGCSNKKKSVVGFQRSSLILVEFR